MGRFITWYIMMLVCDALIGLIPFGLGKYLGKPHLGQLGLILCSVSALLHPALPLAVAVAFVIGMCIAKNDIRIILPIIAARVSRAAIPFQGLSAAALKV